MSKDLNLSQHDTVKTMVNFVITFILGSQWVEGGGHSTSYFGDIKYYALRQKLKAEPIPL